jgi:hypothetical protein
MLVYHWHTTRILPLLLAPYFSPSFRHDVCPSLPPLAHVAGFTTWPVIEGTLSLSSSVLLMLMCLIRFIVGHVTRNLIRRGGMIFCTTCGKCGVHHYQGLLAKSHGAPSSSFHRRTLMVLRCHLWPAVITPKLDAELEIVSE